MKDIISTLDLVEKHIDRLTEEGIYEIERDIILERMRDLYSKALWLEPKSEGLSDIDAFLAMQTLEAVEEKSEPVAIQMPNTEEALVEEETDVEEPLDEVEIEEPEEGPEEELEIEPAKESEPEEEEELMEDEVVDPEEESAEEPFEAEVVELEEAESEPEPEEDFVDEESTLDLQEEVKVAVPFEGEIDHKIAMSLYVDDEEDELDETPVSVVSDEDEELEEETEEEIEEDVEEVLERAVEVPSQTILGEVLATEQTTVAESLTEQGVSDVATAATSSLTLRQAIGVNDKFILLRDLFANDDDYYAKAIDTLDSFDNLDEAMLYIYDNFHWNPNSEGARLLMELLARKLF